MYLGLSPEHARSVCLILSLTTGLVSAQFHVRADENFETVGSSPGSPGVHSMVYQSLWQQKHGFTVTAEDLLARPASRAALTRQRRMPHPHFQAQPSTPLSRQYKRTAQPKLAAPDHLINCQPASALHPNKRNALPPIAPAAPP